MRKRFLGRKEGGGRRRSLTAVDPETTGFQETVNGLEVLDDVASRVEEEAGDAHVPRACHDQRSVRVSGVCFPDESQEAILSIPSA